MTDTIVESGFRYTEIPHLPNGGSIYGYFQSYLYFQEQMPVITQILRLDDLREEVHRKLNALFQAEEEVRLVSMHFRFGDYKQLPECHPLLTKAYYENALNHIASVATRASRASVALQVLSFYEKDDEKDVLEIVNYLKDKFPEHKFTAPSGLQDYEEMLAMSLCDHHIIANSSFSWWGAYLNPNPDKVVCYPDIWFGPKLAHDTSTLCPPEWHKTEAS
jgi:hypothetical protein